jgi:leukotriene-A4 hydrolase
MKRTILVLVPVLVRLGVSARGEASRLPPFTTGQGRAKFGGMTAPARTRTPLLVSLLVSLLLVLGAPAACRTAGDLPASSGFPHAPPENIPEDAHSWAQPNRVRVTHVKLALTLDFDQQIARGSAELHLERPNPNAPLVLDARGLEITGASGPDGKGRSFQRGKEVEQLGAPLTITLEPGDHQVRIDYRTSRGAEALQWLEPEQTRDRRKPFLFTQGQSILTRTWIPLQDTPGVRVTYEAAVRAPPGITVVMSAEQLGLQPDGAWHFRLTQPIPPYLIALAAGDLAFSAISPRSGVWAEPSLVEAARAELADTETMIQAAEALFGPYRWGRYDIIVLPPSFPFGGMENPRLTFATPTILAGDKSLVALVAHELAHSWSGNLVTNATWRDFWLNEGFTSYCEQRIMERVFGAERSKLERQLSRDGLERELMELEPWQEVLHIDLAGKHPDQGFSDVPYQKGSLFLQRLELTFGRPAFDVFLRGWFDAHAFRSVTTSDLVSWMKRKLFPADPGKAAGIDLVAWLEKPGLPPDAPRTASEALGKVDVQQERFLSGAPARLLDTRGWVTQQWQHFIKTQPADLPLAKMAELDSAFQFTRSGNSEILSDWLLLAIKRGYRAADERLAEFLLTCGRRKFLKPLYTELARTEEGKKRARAIYTRARPGYHAVATVTIDEILGWKI